MSRRLYRGEVTNLGEAPTPYVERCNSVGGLTNVNLPRQFVFRRHDTIPPGTQTSRLGNSQDAMVMEMRAKSERTAAKIRAENDLYVTEKVQC